MPRHVSCSACGAIFHPEDLGEDGLCDDCRAADRAAIAAGEEFRP